MFIFEQTPTAFSRTPQVEFRHPHNNQHPKRFYTHQSSAIAALCNAPHPPEKQKLPPRVPAPCKTKQIFALHRRVLLGEVLGERGRLGGGEPRLSRGGSPPPRSSFPTPNLCERVYRTKTSDGARGDARKETCRRIQSKRDRDFRKEEASDGAFSAYIRCRQ